MMPTLVALPRETTLNSELKTIRSRMQLPGVLYGPEIKNISLAVDYLPFEKLYREAGESTLIELDLGGAKHTVIIKAIQIDPRTNRFSHADFYAMSMKKEMEADVELRFVGESSAVKNLGGTLVKAKDSVTIRCLPQYLVHAIDVPISALNTFDDVITVADLTIPEGVKILDGVSEAIVKVAAPLTEEQLKAMEADNAADVSKIEVIGKKEKEIEAESTDASVKTEEKK